MCGLAWRYQVLTEVCRGLQSLRARRDDGVGQLQPPAAMYAPAASTFQSPTSPAAGLLSPRQMPGHLSQMLPGLDARSHGSAERFSRPTPIRTHPVGTHTGQAGAHSMDAIGGGLPHELDTGNAGGGPLGFASPQRSGANTQGRHQMGQTARPGSPFDGNIEGHDEFSLLGDRFPMPVPGSPHGPHGMTNTLRLIPLPPSACLLQNPSLS